MKTQIFVGAICIVLCLSIPLAAYANRGSGRKNNSLAINQQTEQPTETPKRGDGRES